MTSKETALRNQPFSSTISDESGSVLKREEYRSIQGMLTYHIKLTNECYGLEGYVLLFPAVSSNLSFTRILCNHEVVTCIDRMETS